MSEDPGDRRRFRRMTFIAPVVVTTPAGRWSSRILDISMKGVLLEAPGGWSGAGANAACGIKLPLDPTVSIRLSGYIVHDKDGHLGFEWTNMDADSFAHLRRLLELNLGDTELVNREVSALIAET